MLVGPKFGFKLKLSFASSSRFNHLASQFENVQNCLTRPFGRADKDIFGGSDFILKLDTHQPLHSHYQKYHFLGAGENTGYIFWSISSQFHDLIVPTRNLFSAIVNSVTHFHHPASFFTLGGTVGTCRQMMFYFYFLLPF